MVQWSWWLRSLTVVQKVLGSIPGRLFPLWLTPLSGAGAVDDKKTLQSVLIKVTADCTPYPGHHGKTVLDTK